MATKTLYWKSTCTSCRDARAALRARGLEFADVNYAKRALTVEEVRRLVAAAGSVTAVLNTRHAVAKEKEWARNPPTAEEFARAVTTEPNLIRRPILLVENAAKAEASATAIVGFDRAAYSKLS
jgi:arsenate reductase-like glutaredoxin family protein